MALICVKKCAITLPAKRKRILKYRQVLSIKPRRRAPSRATKFQSFLTSQTMDDLELVGGEDGGALGSLESLGAGSLVGGAGALLLERDEGTLLAHLEDLIGGDEVEAVDELLGDHAGDGDHRDAAVVDLLELHVVEPGLVLALGEVEGVEGVVTGGVVGLEEEELVGIEGVLPRVLDAGGLDGEDEGAEETPEEAGDLLEVVDGGAGDLGVEEEGGALDLLADEEAERGEHGNAAVGDLDVSVALGLAGVDAVEEAEGVDTLGEGGAASDGARLDSLLDVGVLLAGLDLDGAGGRSLGDNVESADAGHVFGVCVGGKVEDVRVKSPH